MSSDTDHSARETSEREDDEPAETVETAETAETTADTTESTSGDDRATGDDAPPASGTARARGRRDVEVPMRLYKTITVFSTLIAVVFVVSGFVLVDAATLQVSFLRAAITGLLAVVGLSVAPGVLSTVLAVVGLLVIGSGAGVYTLSTRFRARGMGNSQEDPDEHSDNG